jgi:hypothetical protein
LEPVRKAEGLPHIRRQRRYSKTLEPKSSEPTITVLKRIAQAGTKNQERLSLVNKKTVASIFAVVSGVTIITLVSSLTFGGQKKNTTAAAPSNIASYLPASDAVAIVDVKRMLNETMPSILGSDQAKLAQANAEVDKFKTKTGLDLRQFNRVAVGMRYAYPNATTTKLETVAIAHGTFDAKDVSASARAAALGKSREEKYRGLTITIINVNDQIKLLGLWNMTISELAICPLDPTSLALGTLANVKAAIDAGKAGRAPAELISLATKDPAAVIGFGANITPELVSKLDLGNDTIAKDVSSIKQAYGSVGSTQSDVTVMMVARTDSAGAAKNLGDTVEGLRQLGTMFIGRLADPRRALAESALNNLKVTARETEVEIRTQVAAANLAALIK